MDAFTKPATPSTIASEATGIDRAHEHVTAAGVVKDPVVTPSPAAADQAKVASDKAKTDEKPVPPLPDGPLNDMEVSVTPKDVLCVSFI